MDVSESVPERLRKWCEGKPLALAIIATQIAFGVDDCYELINMLRRQNGLFVRLRFVALDERLPFYRSIWNLVRSLLTEMNLSADDVDKWITRLQKLFSNSEADKDDIRREIASVPVDDLRKLIRAGISDCNSILDDQIRDLAGNEAMNDAFAAEVAEAVQTPAIHFLLSVLMPCWVLTGQLPDRVMASAVRSGTVTKQLRELIRIDQLVMHVPSVRDLLHPPARHLMQSRRKWLATTLTGDIHKISRGDIRYRFGRLIMELAERLAYPLKSPDVEELMLIAASVTRPDEIHGEFEIEPATFRYMTNRLSGFWELTSKRDTKFRKRIDASRKAFS